MQIVNNRIQANKPKLTVAQMMFMGVKGFGHLATMAGTVYLIASFIYLAVNSASFLNVIAGLLIIAVGHQLQQLGDKLEERHVLNAQHLDFDIRQLTTRILIISLIVSLIIFV